MVSTQPTYNDIVKLWQSFEVKSPLQMEAYLDSFAVLFSYNSGAIENRDITYHDTHEIFENGKVIQYTGDLKTLYEIENLKRAYDLMILWFEKKQAITQEAIKQMHKVLTSGTYDERRWELGERPGIYRKNDIGGVGKNDVSAPVAHISTEVDEVLDQLDEVGISQILVSGTWFHLKFESIHPFADGNGRVGRALLNYYFVTHNHPPVVIFTKDKVSYYEALEAFDQTGTIDPMKVFLEKQLQKTWQSTYDRHKVTKGKTFN